MLLAFLIPDLNSHLLLNPLMVNISIYFYCGAAEDIFLLTTHLFLIILVVGFLMDLRNLIHL